MKEFTPRCIADMKDPKCHFYIRIYEKTADIDKNEITEESISVNKGFEAKFIKEVEAKFVEWFQGDYRLIFPYVGSGSQKAYNKDFKELDIWYVENAKFKEWHDNHIFVLVIKKEEGFESCCK